MPVPVDHPDHPWPQMRGTLRRAVGEGAWNLWLAALEPGELDGRRLLLHAPDEKRRWISARYGRLLQATAADVLGSGAQVEVVGGDAPVARPDRQPPGGSPAALGRPEINPRLTFDQFVIGESNRLAHGAALSVAEHPGMAYNPLFICGPPGLGKTHLLQSIANYIRTYGDGLTVRCTTCETFTNEFLNSIHGGDATAFKESHRGVDILLVDDVQFLQSKARTEEEFFHTFNALHAAGAQIVLTSDRPPQDLDALEDRLRERFEAGLVCDVRPPNLETRVTILRKRIQQDGIENCDPDALEAVASRVRHNVRTLEGALIRVVAFGSLTGRPVTAELADEVLSGLYPDLAPARKLTIEDVQLHVCAAFGLSLEELLSSGREPRLAWPRQLAMHLARELTEQTLPAIGRAFRRGHTTVLHAGRRTRERIASDPEAFALVDRLTRELSSPDADRPA